MPTLKLIDLIAILRRIRDIPKLDYGREGLRTWLVAVLDVGQFLADKSAAAWDDALLATLRGILIDNEKWGSLYDVLAIVFSFGGDAYRCKFSPESVRNACNIDHLAGMMIDLPIAEQIVQSIDELMEIFTFPNPK